MTNHAKHLLRARGALGRISTLAVAFFLAPAGCVPAGWGPTGSEVTPEPEPEPEPQPEPGPDCAGQMGYSAYVALLTTPENELEPRAVIVNCSADPLYVFAEGCFGTVARLEHMLPDGSAEVVLPPFLCAWGGPTDPAVVAPFDSAVQSNQEYNNFLADNPGSYRFVFRVSYEFDCPGPPPGEPWPCAEEQPWVELATPVFTVGG